MTILRYIIRSLWFYRKQHLALFAGTVISTAVLTGALIVGDSVKYSLLNLVDVRLGEARYALQTGDRFVRAALATDVRHDLKTPVLAMYMSEGMGVNPELDLQVNKLQVLGIDSAFQDFFNVAIPEILKGEVLLSSNLARKLDLEIGSQMILRARDVDIIPLNAPFARDAKPSVGLRVKVKGILEDEQMGRFSLKSNQAAPFNLFVDRDYITDELGISGFVNTLLISDKEGAGLTVQDLNKSLKKVWQPADLSLKIKELPDLHKYEISSDRVFVDEPIARVIDGIEHGKEKVLTYLVNNIRTAEYNTPYSFVTAATPPYVEQELGDHEIVINDWLSEDLGAGAGDTVVLDYFVVGPMRKLQERSHTFIVSNIIETGKGLINSSLMPEYPGLADANNCRDWNTGIPINLDAIRDKDESYWDDYKGTPKAMISFRMGQTLWQNEFGGITAFRFDINETSREALGEFITANIDPSDLNLGFRPVYEEGLRAANNSVNFGELFLSLSFFVIAAGLLLTILLYSLHLHSRMPESGLLSALGFSRRKIIEIQFAESAIIALVGGLAGAALGVFYNLGLMAGLNSVWKGAVSSYILDIYLIPETIFIGALSGIVLASASIYILTSRILKHPVSAIIKNTPVDYSTRKNRFRLINRIVIYGSFGMTGLLVLMSFLGSVDQNASFLLIAGGLFIVGCLAWLNSFLSNKHDKGKTIITGILQLALKNGGRNKARSMASVALLALGTFTIVITGANRKTFYGAENNRSSGTGGLLYWAETTMPVNVDMNSLPGKTNLGLEDENSIDSVIFIQLLKLQGDDASCLNLNQVQQPSILGVDPQEFQDRNAFSFAKLIPDVDPYSPWMELNKPYPPDVIPAFADQTVITWGLKKKVGDTLYYLNESGERIRILLVGGFENSIFQGNLIIDQQLFRKHFPSVGGSKVILVDSPDGAVEGLPEMLQSQLKDFGIDVETTTNRLAAFNMVENTYLTVFMILGGLGVIIGTIGLGIVLTRNLLDRRVEIALLAAVGFSRKDLFKLILYENISLLVAGIIIGTSGALIGILPSLLSPAFAVPGVFIIWLLVGVFISGLVWIIIPVIRIVRDPLIPALRSE